MEIVKEVFLESKAKDLAEFAATLQNESDVAGLNRMHSDRLRELKELHAGLVENVGFLKNADLAASAYSFFTSNGCSFSRIEQASRELVNTDLMARHADKILAISANAVAGYQANYDTFVKANYATLKKLGLLNKPPAD